jgi:hypothetical protein
LKTSLLLKILKKSPNEINKKSEKEVENKLKGDSNYWKIYEGSFEKNWGTWSKSSIWKIRK